MTRFLLDGGLTLLREDALTIDSMRQSLAFRPRTETKLFPEVIMKSHRSSTRLVVCCGLLLLMAILAPRPGLASTPPSTPLAAPCVSGPTTLCLNNQRFQLDVQWKDFQGNTGVGQAVSLTSDTGYFWFFANTNVELVVKVLDGRGLNNHYWVFFGALSNVEYTMRVTDSETGNVKTYFNPSGRFASVGDTEAFTASGSVASAYRYVEGNDGSLVISEFTPGNSPEGALERLSKANDNAIAQALANCVGTETNLCLNNGRFRVAVTWKDFAGNTGVGKAISLTHETGYFWFFSNTNVELVVKVLDARGLGNRFWVFYGALSNVEYEMTVTDTLTGNVSTYSNPSGRFASTGDTDAFRAGHSVAVRLDSTRAVTKDIPTAGGSISATAGNGTVFTLTIPPDALLSKERITMTPVAGIDGLPLSGGLAAGVDLAPSGLRLFQMATLTMTPAAAIPIAEEVTFAWRGSGDEFFLYPPELDRSNISMKLMHFGGYGVGRGSAADQAAQQLRVPASPEDALSQRLQDLLANRRRSSSSSAGFVPMGDPDSEFFGRVEAELRDYYNARLKDQLQVAKEDCKKGKSIIPKALSWARSVELLGLGSAFAGEIQGINAALIAALVNCYNEAFEICVNRNDPAQAREMLAILRQLDLLGARGQVDESKIARCAHFDLDFFSVIEEKIPQASPFSFRHQVSATVPLEFSPETGPSGSGELMYESVTYAGPSPVCPAPIPAPTSNGLFRARTDINLNLFEGDAPPPSAVTMDYVFSFPEFRFTYSCPGASFTYERQSTWGFVYDRLHRDEKFNGVFVARDWDQMGGAVYARKTYGSTTAEATETTTMILRHTPQ